MKNGSGSVGGLLSITSVGIELMVESVSDCGVSSVVVSASGSVSLFRFISIVTCVVPVWVGDGASLFYLLVFTVCNLLLLL